MSISTKSDTETPLYCELCNYISFNSYIEFNIHHLKHIRQPLVRLVKLNPKLYAKLQKKSYEVNTGVARRSFQFEHVPPLKISVVNQQGLKQFQVINQKRTSSTNNSSGVDYFNSSNYREETKTKNSNKGYNISTETEGTNLLERFGANISVNRKSKSMPQTLCKATLENSEGNGKKESDVSQTILDSKKDALLERLSGIGGISISKSKSTNGTLEAKPSSQTVFQKSNQILVSTKEKSVDLNHLIKLKDQEDEKKTFDKNKILEKLSGSGLICIAPLSQGRLDSEKTEGAEVTTKENVSSSNKNPRARLDRSGSIKSEDSNDSEDLKTVSIDQTILVKSNDEDKAKVLNGNSSENGGLKRFVRVKNSKFSKKNIRPEKQNSLDDSFMSEERMGALKDTQENCLKESGNLIMETLIEDKTGSSEDSNENCSKESGRDILERLTDNLCNSVAAEKTERSAEVENSDVSKTDGMESLLLSANSGGEDEHPELSDNNIVNSYPNDQSQKDSLMTLNNPVSNDQPQQDPLMTPNNPVSNGDDINPNFLQNFLDDHHPPPSLQPDNSEFMSLDGLAQTQHHLDPSVGPSYDLNVSETNTPMEQLSQQVQRISNPINVIPQHHMQPPQPPQLHAGVPISPQHISPQQSNSYEALSHMQPPLPPPPLYQGFNMFNQNYQHQTPPQIPRPPMLQQRPQIQPRPFQSLAAPPRQRSRVTKRPIVRVPSSQEIMLPKQRRVDPPLQARPQIQNATAKLPSGITVTPPRKAVEANKAANVLASRGITVTPSMSRQKNNLPAPLLNIGSGISITSSNQNRNNGGFAVPARKSNAAPIVNNHLERPERCTTVDLTQDDEPSNMARNRMGKFSCKLCQKIFTSSVALEGHKAFHRSPSTALPYKCDKCSAEYSASAYLERHKYTFHKTKQAGPDLAIPIVDLNFPGAKDRLLKCGVSNFIPLSQLQSNNNGYFGLPIIQLDMTKEKAMSNLSALGAGNVFVLGKMKALAPCGNH